MASTYVCSQCCRRLARSAVGGAHVAGQKHALSCLSPVAGQRHAHVTGQRNSRATGRGNAHASGQRNASSSSIDGIVAGLPPRPSTRYSRQKPEPSDTPGYHDGDFADYVASAAAKRSPIGRYSRSSVRQAAPRAREHPASYQSQRERPGQEGQREDAVQHQAPVKQHNRNTRAYTSELETLLKNDDVAGAWSFFQQEFRSRDSPAISQPVYRDAAKHNNRLVYYRLLTLVTDRWLLQLDASSSSSAASTLPGPDPSTPSVSDPSTPPLPSPLHVLDRFDQLGISLPAMYHKSVWSIVNALELAASKKIDIFTHPPTVSALAQLFDLWISRLLPEPAKDATKYYEAHLASLVSKRGRDNVSDVVVSAFLTHDLMRRAHELPAVFDQYSPFVTSLDRVFSRAPLTQPQRAAIEARLKRASIPPAALESLVERLAARDPASTQQITVQEPRTMQQLVKHYTTRVSSAIERQNLDTVETFWQKAQKDLQAERSQLAENSHHCLRIYEQFLVAFFELRRPQQGIEVWSAMINSGLQPTVRTWNVMMKSCHISRDIDVMENMWHRMRSEGLQPDVVSWGTRIYGLLRVGSVDDGIAALEQMGREWFASQQQHRLSKQKSENDALPPTAVKPNTAILNSAISALRGRRSRHIPRVLVWGRSFNIEPDIITYNALMHMALSHGETGQAMKILQSMAASNVKPDSSTFTVLFTSLLHSSLLTDMTQAEQEQKIMGLVESFESCGFEVDAQGYALLIDRMLKEYGNIQAGKKIFDHMVARNIKPTPHIYTILMTFYFDSSPPDLYSAYALWTKLQSYKGDDGPILDVIFYDRCMEGFARHGHVGSTMEVLTRMSKEGKRPGWLALLAVVKCLSEKQDWDRLAMVVNDCHRQEGLLSAGMRGRKGQAEFWRFISDMAADLYHTTMGKGMKAIVDAQSQALGSVYE